MVYIHSDKERQPLVLGGFWSREHQNQLKEQGLHHYTHSIFVTIKLLDEQHAHSPKSSHLSLFISVVAWLFYMLVVRASAPPRLHSVFLQSDLNRNNIVNWGYCE